jgi:hypothetical protein
MGLFYRALRIPGIFLRYRVIGLENVRHDGPALYVANHLNTLGPLLFFFALPIRFHPWVKADLVDARRSPPYLYKEFVQPILHLKGRPGLALARVCSWLSVPLIRQLGSVPVESGTGWTGRAFRGSMALLAQNKHVLIFPEDPQGDLDPETRIHAFAYGFAELCRLYQKRTGHHLPVYPMAVHPARKVIAIAEAEFYRAQGNRREDVRRFGERVQERIRQLYLDVQNGLLA